MPDKNQDIKAAGRTVIRMGKLRSVLEKRQSTLTVVAENIYDPHNLSAMLRSCDAVGILEVSLVYDGSQPYPKIGAKSSASAKKWIDTKKYSSIVECYDELKSRGFKIYSTHLSKNSISVYEADLTKPTAFVFGNERDGVSNEAAELADENLLIPQVGMIQSLNISVACAICLYEAFRQRLEAGMYEHKQLAEDIFETYLENWLRK